MAADDPEHDPKIKEAVERQLFMAAAMQNERRRRRAENRVAGWRILWGGAVSLSFGLAGSAIPILGPVLIIGGFLAILIGAFVIITGGVRLS